MEVSHTAPEPSIGTERFRRGYGTYEVGIDRLGDERYTEIVATALEAGFRHVDTARIYDTEPHVGTAVAHSGLEADEVFVATKLWIDELGYDDAITAAEASRERLGVDSIDLLYVHVPAGDYDPEETLPALDHLVDTGVVNRLGLSNFTPELLREALDHLDSPVFAHQVEMHPLLHQETLHDIAVEEGHWLVAFSPYLKGFVREIAELRTIAERHDMTTFDVSLAWLLSKPNVAVLSHSTNETHMRETVTGPTMALADGELAAIDAIDREYRVWDSRSDPWNQPAPARFVDAS